MGSDLRGAASRFVIVRHGNTFAPGEAPRRIGARTDLPLTPAGEEQGVALGRHFAALGWHFARALVSPLARTRATAAAILACQPKAPALVPEPCDWLREIDHGPDENQGEDAVIARIGAEALAAWDAHGVAPRDWLVDAESRLAAWHAFLATAPGPALLVTSNGAARFALLAIGAVADRPLKLATGAYGVICRDADGTLRVESWNVRP